MIPLLSLHRDESLRSLAQGMLVVLLTCFVCNCSSTPIQQPPPVPLKHQSEQGKTMAPEPATPPSLEARLRAAVRHWAGTPHRMGGNGRSGIDCSGFVQRVYHDLFNIRLPRSTALQVQTGTTIPKKELRSGDLVFFHPPRKNRHVGIYLSNGEFAHASTSRGITISRLSNPYWRDAYWTAKRVMPSQTYYN